ncbi:UbiX family flavin prenyltransferase [Methanohalophilus sp.]|uniref:UbiX family flavin prenyltransferase n=1 Tax=Methanohalophilus sp. TaxID=1966352 RepID=UPI0026024041|nr:UbiX family flavin prenyltransferase [Methanohalophilus sp.]MDK2891781.1 flavin prenyltransferase [Methanohalophilus sp.]
MEIAIGISGASGAQYGIRLLEVLSEMGITTHLIITNNAEQIISIETEYDIENIKKLADSVYDERDFTAPIASGSHKYDALIVAPCSMKTVAAIANGFSDNLIERAADVCLKEGRKVILMVRETPFSQIHLENLLKLKQVGADILPASPAFYNHPATIDDLINFMVGRVLDLLRIDNDIYKRWK